MLAVGKIIVTTIILFQFVHRSGYRYQNIDRVLIPLPCSTSKRSSAFSLELYVVLHNRSELLHFHENLHISIRIEAH